MPWKVLTVFNAVCSILTTL